MCSLPTNPPSLDWKEDMDGLAGDEVHARERPDGRILRLPENDPRVLSGAAIL